MKLPTSLVAVKKITSHVARSSFSADTIEQIARLIIDVEGTINPIILQRTSLESYEVVEGHLEYYGAVRAREMSPLKGEMIQAIILEVDNEKSLLEQVKLLRKGSDSSRIPNPNTSETTSEITRKTTSETIRAATPETTIDLEFRFANLEKVFQSQFEELRRDNRNLERSIADLSSKLERSLLALSNKTEGAGLQEEVIDAIVKKLDAAIRSSRKTSQSSTKRTPESLKADPVQLNRATKAELLQIPGIGNTTASLLLAERDKRGGFTSIEEISPIVKKSSSLDQDWREFFVISSASP